MPVRKLQSYEVDYQEELSQQVPRYQDYTPEVQSDANLKEILFFVNIAVFCICIAIFSFIFLALKLSTALAFVAAIGSSLLVLKVQRSIIKRKRSKINPKYRPNWSDIFYFFFLDGVWMATFTSKIVPFGLLSLTVMVPFSASTICLAKDNPKPKPPFWRVLALSTR